MMDLIMVIKNLAALIIGSLIAGIAIFFAGEKNQNNKDNEQTLRYVRKKNKINEDNSKLSRDELIDKL